MKYFLICAVFLMVSCMKVKETVIEYVLPNNFQGVFEVRVDESQGVEAILKENSKYSIYTLPMPKEGLILLKSFDFSENVHYTMLSDNKGKTIYNSYDRVPDKKTVHSLYVYISNDSPEGVYRYVYGTADDVMLCDSLSSLSEENNWTVNEFNEAFIKLKNSPEAAKTIQQMRNLP